MRKVINRNRLQLFHAVDLPLDRYFDDAFTACQPPVQTFYFCSRISITPGLVNCTSALFDPEIYRPQQGGQWTAVGRYPLAYSGCGRQGFQYYDRLVAQTAVDYLENATPEDSPFFCRGFYDCGNREPR